MNSAVKALWICWLSPWFLGVFDTRQVFSFEGTSSSYDIIDEARVWDVLAAALTLSLWVGRRYIRKMEDQ